MTPRWCRGVAAGLVLGVGAASSGLLSGCTRAAPAPEIGAVRVEGEALDALVEAGIGPEEAAGEARAALVEAGFVLDPKAAAPLRARVTVAGVDLGRSPSTGQPRGAVEVEVSLSAPGDAEPARRALSRSDAPVEGGRPAAALQRALRAAVRDAARRLLLDLVAGRKAVPALLADLDSSDERVREAAVEALADRGDRAAVPALIRCLQDRDPAVVQRAVGALSALRDRRAVSPLIDLTRGGDPVATLQIVGIVGEIGGPDAEGWLATEAQAEPDPRIRAAAAAALGGIAPSAPARK